MSDLSEKTAVDWFYFCRNLCSFLDGKKHPDNRRDRPNCTDERFVHKQGKVRKAKPKQDGYLGIMT